MQARCTDKRNDALDVCVYVYTHKAVYTQVLCELMNLCMCTCDNKFSIILKAVILLETIEVAWYA